jgi:paraquat-inducible protein B
MSQAANKTMIGAFVLGAVALAVIAVVIFGSGKLLTKELPFELYFEGSVQGLEVGSPVMFRGVKLGTVTDIELQFVPQRLTFYIPVTIELEPDKMKLLGPRPKRQGELLKPLIAKGLRGQLQTLSFVTGQLAGALDFFPDKPARYLGLNPKYPEIPTIPSTFAQLTKTAQELPVRQLFDKLDATVGAIQQLVESDEAKASLKSLDRTLREAGAVMNAIGARIGPLAESLQQTSEGINEVADKVSGSLSGKQGVPMQLQQTLEAMRKTLVKVEETLASLEAMTHENTAIGYELGTTLSEMSRSLRSLRVMTDYLERHPDALLKGKGGR